MSENNSNMSFWQLLTECRIIVPQLQRDYAQGREDENIKQIREALVAEFYDALKLNKPLVLNFIYGDRADETFTPIDGQQRLTSLFLLHWYIFSRSFYDEGLDLLSRFSYKTRDSSKRFCERICGIGLDFDKESIKEQIEDCFWFSGNFKSDPTVQSMLVVLDTIHSRFRKESDYGHFKDALIGDNCPISFLWQPMDNFQKTDDLYIKMNARGKLLSDFEIFKAKLQNSSLLDEVLKNNASEADKVVFISKFNNQYAELFYKYHQKKYDEVMMSFVISVVRDEYYSYVSSVGVPQKDYRDRYKQLQSMNGNIFFRFIEAGGDGFDKCSNARLIFVNAIKNIDELLGMFCGQEYLDIKNTLGKTYYSEEQLFKSNFDFKTQRYDINVARVALYEYLLKFGIPKTEDELDAYNMWKRCVFNMVNNTKFGGRSEDICEAMVVLKNMVADMILEASDYDVLTVVGNYDENKSTTELKYQQKEESIKAKLIQQDDEWKDIILEAENYYEDGQIGFLLLFSQSGSEYDIRKFKDYYLISKQIFSKDKKVSLNCDNILLEQALLCMQDNSSTKTAHLEKQSNSTTTWGFCREDYSGLLSNRDGGNRREIVKQLFEKLGTADGINDKLVSIIEASAQQSFDDLEKWKVPFIQNDLFNANIGRFAFANCIHLGKNNTEILLLAGTTVRSYSMELNTLLLAERLRQSADNKEKVRLHMDKTGEIRGLDGFPTRYVEYNDTKVGYLTDQSSDRPYIVEKSNGEQVNLSYPEVCEYFNL